MRVTRADSSRTVTGEGILCGLGIENGFRNAPTKPTASRIRGRVGELGYNEASRSRARTAPIHVSTSPLALIWHGSSRVIPTAPTGSLGPRQVRTRIRSCGSRTAALTRSSRDEV